MQVIKAQEAGAVGVIVADRVIFTLLLKLVPTNNLGHISFILNKNLHSFSQSCTGDKYMCKSLFCRHVLLGSWKWWAVHLYGGRHHRTWGCHPCCVYSWEEWVSQTLPFKISPKSFFQAHDQKNPCPAGDGQCLGEHPSEHQQNCSSPTQPTSMVGLVKSLKTKGKSALAQKLLRNFMFHYCFDSQSSPFYFDAPGLCKW